jgi:hypothetical protein
MRRVLILGVLAALFAASGAALAGGRHGHSHGRVVLGFNFGFPLYAPWYHYPAPVYYYPPTPVYVSPPAPTQYVERNDVAEQAPSPGMWYFCRESNTYYPYVKQCPGGWQRVPAQPSN